MNTKLNILLVDDDSPFRNIIKSILERADFRVTEFSEGKQARDAIAAEKFDLVISDIQMAHFSGLDLLEWVVKNRALPVILMTGFSQLLETRKAHELGAAGFLPKPFDGTDLISMVYEVLKITPSEVVSPNLKDIDFCKISIEAFLAGQTISFPIFIRLTEKKFIKIAHKGEDIDLKQVGLYKSKGITHLFIQKEDYARLVGFNLDVAKDVAISKITAEKKHEFLKYTGEVLLGQAFISEIDADIFSSAKDFVQTSVVVLTNDDSSLNLLMMLNSTSDFIYAHSIGVSFFSVMIANEMGWTSPTTKFRLSLAALFHDIGKKEIDVEITLKDRALLTKSEQGLIESHVLRGRAILESLRAIPDEVVQVAYQHHEYCNGSGYPRKLKKNQIHPFARLVTVANVFCEYVLDTPSRKGIPCKQALEKMNTYRKGEFDEEIMVALSRLFIKKI